MLRSQILATPAGRLVHSCLLVRFEFVNILPLSQTELKERRGEDIPNQDRIFEAEVHEVRSRARKGEGRGKLLCSHNLKQGEHLPPTSGTPMKFRSIRCRSS